MRIKSVDFPELPLLNALRDGRLVAFASAGMSMGAPAELPSFRKLAERVAEGTSQSIAGSETEDQFLGRPQGCKGEESHQLAAMRQQSSACSSVPRLASAFPRH